MKTVHKFPLSPIDEQAVQMPDGAEVLSVQVQHRCICVWAMVDTDRPLADRVFRIHGTGHSLFLSPTAKFVGTVQLDNGQLVFHVFDLGQIKPPTRKE